MKQEKKIYVCPSCEVLEVETQQAMLSSSITGIAPDSNDSEFGAPAKAAGRGAWGDLWSEE